ncbi:MAG: hypothetical protein ACLFQG_10920, partial [Desulfovermiculus sp.]
SLRTEDRGQRTEVRGQKTEIRDQQMCQISAPPLAAAAQFDQDETVRVRLTFHTNGGDFFLFKVFCKIHKFRLKKESS